MYWRRVRKTVDKRKLLKMAKARGHDMSEWVIDKSSDFEYCSCRRCDMGIARVGKSIAAPALDRNCGAGWMHDY